MTDSIKLKVGDPVILTEDVDNLKTGTAGMLNSVVEIEGIEYGFFMPVNEQKSYVLRMGKLCYIDEDEMKHYPELEALLEKLNAKPDEPENEPESTIDG